MAACGPTKTYQVANADYVGGQWPGKTAIFRYHTIVPQQQHFVSPTSRIGRIPNLEIVRTLRRYVGSYP
jgi:hypothetical protein